MRVSTYGMLVRYGARDALLIIVVRLRVLSVCVVRVFCVCMRLDEAATS